MDSATVVGIALSIALISWAILAGGSPLMFVDIPSLLIVVGGTAGATLVRNPLAAVLGLARVVTKAFTVRLPDPEALTQEVLALSRKSRRDGMLALENAPIEYPFLRKAIALCVDGVDPEQIRGILEADMHVMASRHRRGAQILDGMAEVAPAFGMIGTLIGLVQMLASMNDPAAIGPAMAVALLTTLYGALLANVACIPLAGKLRVRSEDELMAMTVCLEGCLALAQGDNPGAIERKLQSYLNPRQRERGAPAKQDKAVRNAVQT